MFYMFRAVNEEQALKMIDLEERTPVASTSAAGAHSKKNSAARAAIPFSYDGSGGGGATSSGTGAAAAGSSHTGAASDSSASDEEDAHLLDVGALRSLRPPAQYTTITDFSSSCVTLAPPAVVHALLSSFCKWLM